MFERRPFWGTATSTVMSKRQKGEACLEAKKRIEKERRMSRTKERQENRTQEKVEEKRRKVEERRKSDQRNKDVRPVLIAAAIANVLWNSHRYTMFVLDACTPLLAMCSDP